MLWQYRDLHQCQHAPAQPHQGFVILNNMFSYTKMAVCGLLTGLLFHLTAAGSDLMAGTSTADRNTAADSARVWLQRGITLKQTGERDRATGYLDKAQKAARDAGNLELYYLTKKQRGSCTARTGSLNWRRLSSQGHWIFSGSRTTPCTQAACYLKPVACGMPATATPAPCITTWKQPTFLIKTV